MQHRFSRSALAVLAIFGLLIAYPVSIGPVFFLCDYVDVPEPVTDALEMVYMPLLCLPEPARGWIGKWADYWIELVPTRVVVGDHYL